MAFIQTTIAQMRSASDDLKSSNEQFKSKVDELNTSEGKLNSSWEGPANDAFHSAFTKDYQQMLNFYQAMQQFITVLDNSIELYVRAETKNTDVATSRKY